jgi:mannitol-1-phosphate/altronate dehydrogenase
VEVGVSRQTSSAVKRLLDRLKDSEKVKKASYAKALESIDSFYTEKGYLTDKQVKYLNLIADRYKLDRSDKLDEGII